MQDITCSKDTFLFLSFLFILPIHYVTFFGVKKKKNSKTYTKALSIDDSNTGFLSEYFSYFLKENTLIFFIIVNKIFIE